MHSFKMVLPSVSRSDAVLFLLLVLHFSPASQFALSSFQPCRTASSSLGSFWTSLQVLTDLPHSHFLALLLHMCRRSPDLAEFVLYGRAAARVLPNLAKAVLTEVGACLPPDTYLLDSRGGDVVLTPATSHARWPPPNVVRCLAVAGDDMWGTVDVFRCFQPTVPTCHSADEMH